PFNAFAREVRVGIYENYPKVFTTDQGEPSGIFVDILESIANDEGWTLQYIHGNWAECLERLESGEIDLMMDVAYSDARDEIYDFCDNNIVSNWAQVYTRDDLEIDILTDLEGMRISTMHGGIHLIRLEALIDGFGMNCEIVLVDDYETVFMQLHAEEVDAGVVNRVFGYANAERFDISRSPVVFSPASLRYAVKAGCNDDLIVAIDTHLTVMKDDPGSVYHQTLRKWLGETSRFTMPGWIRTSVLIAVATAALLFAMTILLRHKVKARTRDLVNTNLELSKQVKKTMKAHLDLRLSEDIRIRQERLSALGQMVFGIAHDFNNMLTPILGYSDLLLETRRTTDFPGRLLEYLKIIGKSAEDARETVKRLQESMRADTGLLMESVIISELVSEAVRSVQPIPSSVPEHISSWVKVTESVPDDLIVTVCRSQLKEALQNILINSIHAVSPGDEIHVVVFADSEKVTLEVADTGKGMSEKVLHQCTEPFFTTKGSLGTGMGLAMVYGIMQRHCGELKVESTLDEGTTVTMTLPLVQDTAEAIDIEASNFPVTPMKVLIIDDDASSLKLIAAHLEHDDHSVTAIEDSVEAVSVFQNGDFDLVITDMAMPDVSGEELAQQIKSISPDTPILMITGFAVLLRDKYHYPKGISFIVGKPFTLGELRSGIRKALGILP
ncbi:MAG: transporter substrate-binding domain-containing protein, partial [Candidatus Sabulitectum sp.]|nr:transporter substrate-binding domain-containing protein [Candidatus Sabulitectum sp.]